MILFVLVSAVVTVALDQASKALASRRFVEGKRYALVGRSAHVRRVSNRRAGLLPLSPRGALLLWVALVIAAGLLVAAGPRLTTPAAIGLGLLAGGAAGNVIDRLTRGAVVDFFRVGPSRIFNVADVALVAGTALVFSSLL